MHFKAIFQMVENQKLFVWLPDFLQDSLKDLKQGVNKKKKKKKKLTYIKS